ncbi:MAG: hypothetical protein IJE07_10485 [Clostridia bacterium]|nr:hypothetical protein [Clostridia bacterium]
MYMDFDSILFGSRTPTTAKQSPKTAHWVRRIDEKVLTREDLCAIYGFWAEDAAESEFLDPEDGGPSLRFAYAV